MKPDNEHQEVRQPLMQFADNPIFSLSANGFCVSVVFTAVIPRMRLGHDGTGCQTQRSAAIQRDTGCRGQDEACGNASQQCLAYGRVRKGVAERQPFELRIEAGQAQLSQT